MQDTKKLRKILLTHVLDMDELSVQASKCLRDNEIYYAGDILKHTESHLMGLKTKGAKEYDIWDINYGGFAQIKDFLDKNRLHLGMKIPDAVEVALGLLNNAEHAIKAQRRREKNNNMVSQDEDSPVIKASYGYINKIIEKCINTATEIELIGLPGQPDMAHIANDGKRKPASFEIHNSDELFFARSSEVAALTAKTVKHDNTHRKGYVQGNVPVEAKIVAGHGDIYIQGSVLYQAQLSGEACIFSARNLAHDVSISGGHIMILGNDSYENMTKEASGHKYCPPILIVPENKRLEVFDHLSSQNYFRDDFDRHKIPTRTINDIQKNFPDIGMKLYFKGEQVRMPTIATNQKQNIPGR